MNDLVTLFLENFVNGEHTYGILNVGFYTEKIK